MTRYLIRAYTNNYWLQRGTGLTSCREEAYRFTLEEVVAIIKGRPVGWFKKQTVLIPVEVSE